MHIVIGAQLAAGISKSKPRCLPTRDSIVAEQTAMITPKTDHPQGESSEAASLYEGNVGKI
jgi:hypothetical protein